MSWWWVHWGAGMILLLLAGIAILVADPGSPLFLYVSRPLAAFVGLLLLLPAILLIALGRGISLIADCLAHAEPPRETS